MARKGSKSSIWIRRRGHLYFQVDDAHAAARRVSVLFTQGGDNYVIIRADVVDGHGFNLMVPIDAADTKWTRASRDVQKAVGAAPTAVSRVVATYPENPQCAHSFITEEEYLRCPLPECAPPGRHPKSPGANPWG